MLDKAGNTLNTARNLTITPNVQAFTDWVGSSDINDFYSFSLTSRSSLNIVVDGLSANADVQIIRDKNSNGVIDSGEVIAGAYKKGTLSESIRKTLNAGDYFIRVYAKDGNTNYNLKVFQNFAPNSLQFKLDKTSLNATENLSINSAWVSDNNGTSDISRVDFRIRTPDGELLNVANATTFTPTMSNANKASFDYSLSLKNLNLVAGEYILEGKAYDFTGAGSNTVKQKFTVTNAVTDAVTHQDWFSKNLLNQNIITLTRNLAADGDLSRQDMLDIFTHVQKDSVIDANEVKDLNTLVGAKTPFSMADSVKWLSTQVASGASVNMSASQFESNLVGRWFLGTMAPTPVFQTRNLTYVELKGNLFGSANEARIGDIDQGNLGNCTFLAALGATFERQSDDSGNTSSAFINSMITDNGDDTYTIRFYSNGEAQYVSVDRRIATSGGKIFGAKANGSTNPNNTNNIMWVSLAEKAYAQWQEWTYDDRYSGYNLTGSAAHLSRPLEFVTGQKATNYNTSNISFSTLETALANGQAMTTQRNSSNGNTQFIVAAHAYSVTNVYTNNSGEQRVVVRNPWGVDGRTKSGANDGFIDLSFKEFQQTFTYGVTIA
ncbi:MAG: C2 family cysteine protease [Nostoc sp. LLA-1]|nr:C2 family cysteine protease [Cyanocohniella sp. LLY]